MTTYYASPTGGGSGLGDSSPFTINAFLGPSGIAQAGDTLNLLDGIYAGAGNMIAPRPGLSGTSDTNRITVQALNDGGVTIDAGYANRAVSLLGHSFWTIKGIDCAHGAGTIIRLEAATNNVFQRVVAWDSRHGFNDSGITVYNSSNNNLFEDVAVFGVNRYPIILIQDVTGNTFRRIWTRWEGQINVGPKTAFQASYPNSNVHGNLFENVISTWAPISMPQTYTLQDQGSAYVFSPDGIGGIECTFNGSQTNCTNFAVQNRQGIISEFASLTDGGGNVNQRWFGSLAYLRAADAIGGPATSSLPLVVFQRSGNGVHHVHTLAAVPNFSGASSIFGYGGGFTEGTGTADHVTTMIQGGNNFGSWTVTNFITGTMLASIQSQGADPWTGTNGANLCFRYVDGVKTSTALWPWPMDGRIANAVNNKAGAYTGPCNTCSGGRSTRSGTIVSVTADVQNLLGTIPSPCAGGRTTPPSQNLTISNSGGGGSVAWSASKTQSWLTLSASSGVTPATITLTANPNSPVALAPGVYHDTVTVTLGGGADNSPQTAVVTFTIGTGPSVTAQQDTNHSLIDVSWRNITSPSLADQILVVSPSGHVQDSFTLGAPPGYVHIIGTGVNGSLTYATWSDASLTFSFQYAQGGVVVAASPQVSIVLP